MNRLFILVLSSVGFGFLLATGSLLFNFGHWKQLVLLMLTGMGIGVLLAPVFTPENFKNPILLQIFAGAFAGFFGVYALSLSIASGLLGAGVGAVFGAAAPLWSKPIER